jgi:hypothetical protein
MSSRHPIAARLAALLASLAVLSAVLGVPLDALRSARGAPQAIESDLGSLGWILAEATEALEASVESEVEEELEPADVDGEGMVPGRRAVEARRLALPTSDRASGPQRVWAARLELRGAPRGPPLA